MNEYILFMHDNVSEPAVPNDVDRWARYFATLRASGQFDGGSSIGAGFCFRKGQATQPAETKVSGYIRVRAESLEAARCFLEGNPVYEAGGTVELRELPRN